jgi:hypothetical protein
VNQVLLIKLSWAEDGPTVISHIPLRVRCSWWLRVNVFRRSSAVAGGGPGKETIWQEAQAAQLQTPANFPTFSPPLSAHPPYTPNATAMRNFWALPALLRITLANQHAFSVFDDLLAYPQVRHPTKPSPPSRIDCLHNYSTKS